MVSNSSWGFRCGSASNHGLNLVPTYRTLPGGGEVDHTAGRRTIGRKSRCPAEKSTKLQDAGFRGLGSRVWQVYRFLVIKDGDEPFLLFPRWSAGGVEMGGILMFTVRNSASRFSYVCTQTIQPPVDMLCRGILAADFVLRRKTE